MEGVLVSPKAFHSSDGLLSWAFCPIFLSLETKFLIASDEINSHPKS